MRAMSTPVPIRSRSAALALAGGALASLWVVQPVAAHGIAPVDPPTALTLALDWSFEPLVLVPLLLIALGWIWLIRRVDAAHPLTPVPRLRAASFILGLFAIAVALQSGISRYDTSLFSIHMVQHLLLTLLAPPLLALGAPITLLLRASTPAVRHRWILPVLHSRVVRVAAHPVVGWLAFAGVMWGTHFSALFNASLDNVAIHDFEHVLYLTAGLLFWWPVIGVDPSPYRMSHPVRVLYVFLQMPQNSFLAVAILGAPAPLYAHYVTLIRAWGPNPLVDQQLAAGIMWLAGDLAFLAAILALVAGWARHDERTTVAQERRADAELAAIREREGRLAERLAAERAEGGRG